MLRAEFSIIRDNLHEDVVHCNVPSHNCNIPTYITERVSGSCNVVTTTAIEIIDVNLVVNGQDVTWSLSD